MEWGFAPIVMTTASAIISAVVAATVKKMAMKNEQRDKDASRRAEISMEFMSSLAEVTSEQVSCTLYGKEADGDLERAYKKMQKANENLDQYMRERASR